MAASGRADLSRYLNLNVGLKSAAGTSKSWTDAEFGNMYFYKFSDGTLNLPLVGEMMLKGLHLACAHTIPLLSYLGLKLVGKEEEPLLADNEGTHSHDIDLEAKIALIRKAWDDHAGNQMGSLDDSLPVKLHKEIIATGKEKIIYPFLALSLLRAVYRTPSTCKTHIEKNLIARITAFYSSEAGAFSVPVFDLKTYDMISSGFLQQHINTIAIPLLKKYNEDAFSTNPNRAIITYLFAMPTMYRGMGTIHLMERYCNEHKKTVMYALTQCNTTMTRDQVESVAKCLTEHMTGEGKKSWPWARLFHSDFLSSLSVTSNPELSTMLAVMLAPSGSGGPWNMKGFEAIAEKTGALKKLLIDRYQNNSKDMLATQLDFEDGTMFGDTALDESI